MKKLLCLVLALIMTVIPLTACGEKIPYDVTDEQTNLVIIDVKKYGKIVVELYPEVAPITVENFKKLVSEKFYDGLVFHRVIEDFMIQGGGYNKNHEEKPAASIKGEFASNGVQNDLLHKKGVISMARTTVPDSASSQFFIVRKTSPHLDGEYAAFGMTVYGIDVIDKIAVVETRPTDWPVEEVVIKSIRFGVAK